MGNIHVGVMSRVSCTRVSKMSLIVVWLSAKSSAPVMAATEYEVKLEAGPVLDGVSVMFPEGTLYV